MAFNSIQHNSSKILTLLNLVNPVERFFLSSRDFVGEVHSIG